MKVEGWLFLGCGIFFGGADIVYWYVSHDPTGTTALALAVSSRTFWNGPNDTPCVTMGTERREVPEGSKQLLAFVAVRRPSRRNRPLVRGADPGRHRADGRTHR